MTDRIRREYGSGNYRINVIRNKKLFKIIDYPILAPNVSEPSQTSDNGSPGLSAVIRELRETSKQQFELMKEFINSNSGNVKNASDPVAMMTAMLGAMNQMKEFVQPAQAQTNSFDNFLQLLEVAQNFNSAKGETNFIDVIRDGVKYLGPAIGETLQAHKSGQTFQPVQQAAVIHPPQQTQGEQMQQPQQTEMSQAYLIAYINRLVNKAKSGSDPQLQAANILDDFPDEIIQQHLLGPDTIDKLAQVNPDVRNYLNWFQTLQGHLKAAYEPDDSGGEPS